MSQLEELEPNETNDRVDMDKFWNSVESEIITKGFIRKGEKNPCQIIPTYRFWVLGLDRKVVSPMSEYRKPKPMETEGSNQDIVIENILFDLVSTKQASVIRNICQKCNVDSNGSTIDCLFRLRDKLKVRSIYDKVFSKVWGASGGWLKIMCPHRVTYYIKCLLRAESPHDHVDALLSFKYHPTNNLY